MIWSDHEEAVYQLRRRRQRVLQRLMLVTFAHAVSAIVLETYTRHHRALHLLTSVAFIASLAGLGSVALLGARWGLHSNATETWSATRQRRGDRRSQRARRAQAVRDGTWRPGR